MLIYEDGVFIDKTNGAENVLVVKDVGVSLTAATANQQVIAAVSGKILVVVSGSLLSVGAS